MLHRHGPWAVLSLEQGLTFLFFFKFLLHDISCSITMRTEVKILQHNRLDANSFVSVKLLKQTKTAPISLRGPIKILGMGGNWKHRNFFKVCAL